MNKKVWSLYARNLLRREAVAVWDTWLRNNATADERGAYLREFERVHGLPRDPGLGESRPDDETVGDAVDARMPSEIVEALESAFAPERSD